MKKILSIVAVFALLFALSVPALAAAPTKATVDKLETSVKSVSAPFTATISASKETSSGKAAAGQTEEIFDLKIEDANKTDLSGNGTKATVTFVYDKAGDVVGVYVKNSVTGQWDACSYKVNSDGTITVDFPHLSPVSFVLKSASQTVPAGTSTKPAADAGKAAPAAPAAGKAPQTGYNTVLWAVVAVAMAVCAGYCFSSRKVTAA